MPTREQEFMRVRELLEFPKAQSPSPHSIFSQLIRQEQFQALKLSNSQRPWNVALSNATVTTVANQAEYTISAADFGKPIYVYRVLNNNVLLPVPFTDFQHEIPKQQHEIWIAPMDAGLNPPYSAEKCGFYRTSTGLKKFRLYPIPETAGVVYQIVYYVGFSDPTGFALTDSPILPEFSELRCLQTALFKLPQTEWDGRDENQTQAFRRDLRMALEAQMLMFDKEFTEYISNLHHEPIGQIDPWYA